jgi:magnesium transporter
LPEGERNWAFERLSQSEKFSLFKRLEPGDQAKLILYLDEKTSVTLLAALELEELVPLARHWSDEEIESKLAPLNLELRSKVMQILAADKGTAAGLIRSHFVALSPDYSVDQAVQFLRDQVNEQVHNIYYGYVIDANKKLLGIVPFRQLFLGLSDKKVRDIMKTDIVVIPEQATEEEVAHLFSTHALMAFPVIDAEGRMKGIVTSDNIVTRIQEEATEDIQKLGGMEALDAPYWEIAFFSMVKKRAGWLMALFIGEMFTATAMGYYEREIERAVVLALFIPLIISSGGNSGSQATTLIIRAMALREIRIKDWFRVLFREFGSGLALGLILGSIGFLRIVLWPTRATLYGEHFLMVASTVALSLVGIVLWGTLVGSMLPFILRKLGFDPASASAPFVATLVDVTGLIIYFTVATTILKGTLL